MGRGLICGVSILVLLEPPLIQPSCHNFLYCFLFQSLFYWNLLSYLGRLNIYRIWQPCFNPCFTGTSSHTLLIFFCLIFNRVSILVLLEPPLILRAMCPTLQRRKCFNPCFTGTSSHTNLTLTWQRWMQVSILVLLEPPLILKSELYLALILAVSILVLLEPPLILHFYLLFSRLLSCFNPCFTGTSSHTNWDLLGRSIRWCCFNPCFTGTSSHTQIQSRWKNPKKCFNPCFTGTSSHTSSVPLSSQNRTSVSILVLLEPPLIRLRGPIQRMRGESFNPCFTGTSSHTLFLSLTIKLQ